MQRIYRVTLFTCSMAADTTASTVNPNFFCSSFAHGQGLGLRSAESLMLLVAALVPSILCVTFSGCTVEGQGGFYSCGDCARGHCYGEVFVAVADNISDAKLYGYRTKISIAPQMLSRNCFIDNEFFAFLPQRDGR
jgi:hypothetical protein